MNELQPVMDSQSASCSPCSSFSSCYRAQAEVNHVTLLTAQCLCVLSLDKVALKILDKTRLDSQAQRLLSREITSMEYLQHPNVVHLYEVVETPSRLYLVLEYAGGGDLHNRICSEGKLCDNTSKTTFAQILSAIKYMVSRCSCRPGESPQTDQTQYYRVYLCPSTRCQSF